MTSIDDNKDEKSEQVQEEAVAEDVPVEQPSEEAPAEDTAVEITPEPDTPVEDAPAEDAAVEKTPEPETPAEDAPAEEKTEAKEDKPSKKDEKPSEKEATPSKKEATPEPEVKEDKPAKETPKKKSKKKEDKAPDEEKKKSSKKDEEDEDFRYIVRIAQTNLDGHQTVEYALTSISGIGHRLAIIITDKAGLSRKKKVGKLTDKEIDRLADAVDQVGVESPYWLLNRQMDPEEGADGHLISMEIETAIRDDINMLKKIRCYKGIRHETGQKVRGQKTRANGRSGLTVGVMKSAAARAQQKAGK